jgi:hypothetical protein
MRLLLIACCVLLAGCHPSSTTPKPISNETGPSNSKASGVGQNDVAPLSKAAPEAEAPSAKEQLFDLPESTLETECAAADYYPDHQVHPAFYAYPPRPEYERYIECLVAEARRDGGRVRLASVRSFPTVGACYSARIVRIGSRFGDRPDSDTGTSVTFDNGLYLVAYDLVRPVARSRVGDKVRVCVHDLPRNCPAHDLRGIGYRARNLRTGESWIMGDSQHECRGA